MEASNKVSPELKTSSEDIVLSEAELAEQRAQYKRIAMRMLKAIVKSIPALVPSLKIKADGLMVNNEVKMPLLNEYEGCILPSYVVIKGDKERTLYFCIMKEQLYELIKEILVKDIEVREALTKHTVSIQFACPDINLGLYFKKKYEGLFKGKKTHIYQFKMSENDNITQH
ncbi:MAG: hypothetical protein OQL19_21265 [Gammaproteobacteria bacterium]|nr:hypothetical protein [Gammaproteobacteria bacterium]